jgi:KaiC/GvpD/RAD55 family RecA-like ATPase
MEMVIDPMEELHRRIVSLTAKAAHADELQDFDASIDAKEELYTLKLEYLSMLKSEEALASTRSARKLHAEVQSRPKVPRYETGVSCLDRELRGGIEVGTFVQLAGESYAGKTHLTLEILSNISKYAEVLFFNFEMGDVRIDYRLGKLLDTDQQWKNFLINSKARKLVDIVREIKARSKAGIKFFAIDSKMKIEVPDTKDEYQAYAAISRELAKVAQQEEVIVFLINQINEEDQKTGRMAFKGGGDQMYDSDIALFYMIEKKSGVEPEKWGRSIVCRKNRQDERLFSIKTSLDMRGKTVEFGTNTAEYEYQMQNDTVSMPQI